MAKNRIVNTKFWSDNYISNLDPLEKLLFLYFITNPYTNLSGIYEITIKQIALDTGIDRENLEKVLLPRFANSGKVFYIDGWVYVKNFQKHQKASGNIQAGIKNALKDVPPEIMKKIDEINGSEGGQRGVSIDETPEYELELESKLKLKDSAKSATQKLVNYFFELKGWANKDKDFYKGNKISYSRHLRPAKELVALCEGNLDEAKHCLKKVADWAMTRDLDWAIETVFKKWYDIDILQPKEKKPYYKGNRVFEITGRKYVLMPNGEKLQFAGKETELTYK